MMAGKQTARAAVAADPALPRLGARGGAVGEDPRWRTAAAQALAILMSRWFIAGMVLVSLLLYMQNALHTVDFPEYDEAIYFSRGYLLAHGNLIGAGMNDPGSSPLYIVFYAAWYLLLKTSAVYPFVLTSSVLLLGLGAYLLLSHLFHPVLSWAFALLVVAWSVPFAPNNLYIFATACLWLSLAVLGRRLWRRGLAATLVALCVLLRPDFLPAALLLCVLLAAYEVALLRRRRFEWRALATAYAPLVMLGLWGLYLFVGSPQTAQGRSSNAIAWSYTDFYSVVYPAQVNPIFNFTHPYVLFSKDFGPLPQQASFTATLIAMTHNPTMLARYVGFESARLIAGFGTATLDAPQWKYNHLNTLPVLVTTRDTWWFLAFVACFALISGACYLALRSLGVRVLPNVAAKTPTLLGLVSLLGLLPLMFVVNPHQHFYMLYPLALVPIGLGVRCIVLALMYALRRVKVTRWARELVRVGLGFAFLALALAYLPQPFLGEPPSGPEDAITLAFLRQYVPQHAMIIGEPAESYAYYLLGDGYNVTGVEAEAYEGSNGDVLGNILAAYPTLDNVYVLFNHNISYQANNPWFAKWNAAYPQLPITLVAQRQNPYLQLYHLQPELGARVNYLALLRLVGASQGSAPTGGALPPQSDMDFATRLTWTGNLPQNVVTPQFWQYYGWRTKAIDMYPNLPGAYPIAAHTVTTTLPAAWSGRTLVFAGAFAPWELQKPGADGTQLVFTISGTTYRQIVQLPNTPAQSWRPILVTVPRSTHAMQLQVTVLPRNSLLWDDTLLSFVGLTSGATAPGAATTAGNN